MLGVPFERRGARTSESIRLYKALWTEENPSFHGEFWQIEEVGFAPKPLQKPHPPIWVGGHSETALRRAGRLGDAWHAAYLGPDQLSALYPKVQRYAEEAGRDPASVALTLRTRPPLDDPPRAIELFRAVLDLGTTHVVLEIFTLTLEQAQQLMETFSREVRPRVLG